VVRKCLGDLPRLTEALAKLHLNLPEASDPCWEFIEEVLKEMGANPVRYQSSASSFSGWMTALLVAACDLKGALDGISVESINCVAVTEAKLPHLEATVGIKTLPAWLL